MFPLLYISNVKQQTKQMLFGLVVLSADLMNLCFWNSQASYIIITLLPDSTHVRYIWYHKLLVFCLFGGMGVRPLWPHVNIVWHFLVAERGFNSYSMSLHLWCIPSIPKQRNDMYQKIIINRYIAILSFTFVLTWEQNVHLILLSIANNVTYFKVLFLGSSPHLSSFEICHIVGVWHVMYTSGDTSDWQIIISIHM